MLTFNKAIVNYLSAKSFLSEVQDQDRLLYGRKSLKEAEDDLYHILSNETNPDKINLIETILNN